jgi:rhamnosyltransferase
VVVSDDASPATADDTLRRADDLDNVNVIRHQRNAGIARGLNDGLAAARTVGATWLLTVDQDSHLDPEYPASLERWASNALREQPMLAAVGAGNVVDNDAVIRYPTIPLGHLATTPEVIQTGSLWRVDALMMIGGFDENFAIDAVDAAACVRLRSRGFLIAVADGFTVHHRIGASRSLRVMGRDVMVTGHSPERRTSMLRNRLRLFPAEFRQSPRHALRSIRRVIVNQTVGLVLESDRGPKALGTLRGLSGRPRDTLEP